MAGGGHLEKMDMTS